MSDITPIPIEDAPPVVETWPDLPREVLTRPGPGVADVADVARRAGVPVVQAAVVRPGDTLILIAVFDSIAQALVYRPDTGPPAGHVDVTGPDGHRPVYVSTAPGHDAHGCEFCNPAQNPERHDEAQTP